MTKDVKNMQELNEVFNDAHIHNKVRGDAFEENIMGMPAITAQQAPETRKVGHATDDQIVDLLSERSWDKANALKIDVVFDPMVGEPLNIKVRHLGEGAVAPVAAVESVPVDVAA